MSLAFQITEGDIARVLSNYGKTLTQEQLDSAYDLIDHDEVESAALAADPDEGDDAEILEQQTESAYAEIAAQLVVAGYIGVDDVVRAGNADLLRSLALKGIAVPERPLR